MGWRLEEHSAKRDKYGASSSLVDARVKSVELER